MRCYVGNVWPRSTSSVPDVAQSDPALASRPRPRVCGSLGCRHERRPRQDRLQRLRRRPRGDRVGGAPDRRRDPAGAGRPAVLAEADRERELRLAGRAAHHGHLVQRQVRRGHHRPPVLRRLPERRHRRVHRRRARARAVRGAVRLCPAALGHRRQPGGLLVDPGPPHRDAGAREARGQERQRAQRGGLGVAAARVRQPAAARDVARRGRAPDPRLPAQHQRQDVPPAAVRHRPGDRAPRLRRGGGQGARVQAAWCWWPATRRTRAG